jgi:RsmE family RNA methyltransferase
LHHIDSCDAQKLKSLDFQYQKWINIVVWPEGWFSEKEVWVFESLWFQKVYLGGRILRTETAWVVVWFYVVQNK